MDAGHSEDGHSHGLGRGQEADEGKGALASAMGRLNAVNASDVAKQNAAPVSAVGTIAAYGAAVSIGDLETAAAQLGLAANKTVSVDVVDAVNTALGLDMDEATAQSVADMANEAQAAETNQGLGPPADEADPEGDGEGDPDEGEV